MPRGRGKFSNHPYGTRHKAARKRFAPKVRAGKVACWRCGELIEPGMPWDLGHTDEDGRARGLPVRHPEHRRCNRATVSHLKARLEGRAGRFGGLPDPTPTDTIEVWSRHWVGPFNPRCPDCRRTGEPCDVARRNEEAEGTSEAPIAGVESA